MYIMIADADGGIMKKKVDLKIHPCNMQDVDILTHLDLTRAKLISSIVLIGIKSSHLWETGLSTLKQL
jgi:hypothetical protein